MDIIYCPRHFLQHHLPPPPSLKTATSNCISNAFAATRGIDFYPIKSITTICILDFWHLLEKLGAAGRTRAVNGGWSCHRGPHLKTWTASGDSDRVWGLGPPPEIWPILIFNHIFIFSSSLCFEPFRTHLWPKSGPYYTDRAVRVKVEYSLLW